MKKLKKFFAVMVSAVSMVNIFVARASNPGDDDYIERIRRHSEPAHETESAFDKFISTYLGYTRCPTMIDDAPFYYLYRPSIFEDGRFSRLCDKWRKKRSRVEVECYTLTFEQIRSHLLIILERYRAGHYNDGSTRFAVPSKSDIEKFFRYDADNDICKYLKYVRDKFNSIFKSDDLILTCVNDLPKLVVCPPVLYKCLSLMETVVHVPPELRLPNVM